MSPLVPTMGYMALRFPRVSGDEPQQKVSCDASSKFSPRERG